MTKAEQRLVNYVNGTGHVQGLRARIREVVDEKEAVNMERTLDAIIARAIEIAFDEACKR